MTNRIGVAGAEYTVPVEPDAEDYEVPVLPIAASTRALDGSMLTHYAAVKRSWRLSWPGLTAAQRDSLMTELRRASYLSWEPPEGGDYTVRVMAASWVQTPDTADYYTVRAELEEV